jgi:hypothetical protein
MSKDFQNGMFDPGLFTHLSYLPLLIDWIFFKVLCETKNYKKMTKLWKLIN